MVKSSNWLKTDERTYEVRKLPRYKTRWVALIFEPGDTERSWRTGCDYGHVYPSKRKAERFAEFVIEKLGKN